MEIYPNQLGLEQLVCFRYKNSASGRFHHTLLFGHSIHHLLRQTHYFSVQFDSPLVPIYSIHPVDHLYDLVVPNIFTCLHNSDSGNCTAVGCCWDWFGLIWG